MISVDNLSQWASCLLLGTEAHISIVTHRPTVIEGGVNTFPGVKIFPKEVYIFKFNANKF